MLRFSALARVTVEKLLTGVVVGGLIATPVVVAGSPAEAVEKPSAAKSSSERTPSALPAATVSVSLPEGDPRYGDDLVLKVSPRGLDLTDPIYVVVSSNGVEYVSQQLSGLVRMSSIPFRAGVQHALTVQVGNESGAASNTVRFTPQFIKSEVKQVGESIPYSARVPLSVVPAPASSVKAEGGNIELVDPVFGVLERAYVGAGSTSLKPWTYGVGDRVVELRYAGDARYAPTTIGNGTLTHLVVTKIPTMVYATPSATLLTQGEPLQVSASVHSSDSRTTIDPGTSTLKVFATPVGGGQAISVKNASYPGNRATVSMELSEFAASNPGNWVIRTQYEGNGTAETGFSETTVRINPKVVPTATSLSLDRSSTTVGGASIEASSRVTVTGGAAPTGQVEFLVDGVRAALKAVDAQGDVHASLAPGKAGPHTVVARYLGTSNQQASESPSRAFTVERLATSVSLGLDTRTAIIGGGQLTATADVSVQGGVTPDGQVEFLVDNVRVGLSDVDAAGHAEVKFAATAAGTHAVTAQYLETETQRSAVSPALDFVAEKAKTKVTVAARAVATGAEISAEVDGTNSDYTPTGTVQVRENGELLGSITLAEGHGIIVLPNLPLGSHTLKLLYMGDGSALGSEATIKIDQTGAVIHTTATSLFELNSETVSVGETVRLNAKVEFTASAGAPKGRVAFFIDGVEAATSTLNLQGRATAAVKAPSAGRHQITARYLGEGSSEASESQQARTLDVEKAAAVLSGLAAKASGGAEVSATVVSAPGLTPTGTVRVFKDDALLGSFELEDGAGSTFVEGLAPGPHSLTLKYLGDDSTLAAEASLSVTVDDAPAVATATSLTLDRQKTTVGGQAVRASVEVSRLVGGAVATGRVAFFVDGAEAGTAEVNAQGGAEFELEPQKVGSREVTAKYLGATGYSASTSAERRFVVEQAASTITATAKTVAKGVQLSVVVDAVDSSTVPEGTVKVLKDGELLDELPLSGGTAASVLSGLAIGSYSLVLDYAGDTRVLGSQKSITVEVEVDPDPAAATATSLELDRLKTTVGGVAVVASAAVSRVIDGSVPAGKIAFFVDGAPVGAVDVDGQGRAELELEPEQAGPHAVTAKFLGISGYAVSISEERGFTVEKAESKLTPSSITGAGGAHVSVVVAAPGSSVVPTGVVTVSEGEKELGEIILIDGKGLLVIPDLAPGTHRLGLKYGGDEGVLGSRATMKIDELGEVIEKVATEVKLGAVTSEANPRVPVEVTAVGTTPTGTVTVSEGDVLIGEVTLESGSGVFTLPKLSVGAHELTFAYAETEDLLGSDAKLTIEVDSPSSGPAATTTVLDLNHESTTVGGDEVEATAAISLSDDGVAVPEGQVAFFVDDVRIAFADVDAQGRARVSLEPTKVGSHEVTARYLGTMKRDVSMSPARGYRVERAASKLAPSSVKGEGGAHVSVVATAPGSSIVPTGVVTVSEGENELGEIVLIGGRGMLVVPNLAPGAHMLTLGYQGDDNALGAEAKLAINELGEIVEKAETQVKLGAVTSEANPKVPVEVIAIDSEAIPSGTVRVSEDGTSLGEVPLDEGSGVFVLPRLSAGTHVLTFSYAESEDLFGSEARLTVEADPSSSAATGTELELSRETTTVGGDEVEATAAVSLPDGEAVSEGQVVFFVDDAQFAIVNLDAQGRARISLAPSKVGDHDVTARYLGTMKRDVSTSPARTFTVEKAVSKLTPSGRAVSEGARVSAEVAAPGSSIVPTGVVTVSEGETKLGEIILVAGRGSIDLAGLPKGTHRIELSYSGDKNALESEATLKINEKGDPIASTETSLQLDRTTTTVGGVKIAATAQVVVEGSAVAAGLVGFFVDGTQVVTSSLDGQGKAEVALAATKVGTHAVTARYLGTPTQDISVSEERAIEVQKAATKLSVGLSSASRVTVAMGAKVPLDLIAVGSEVVPTGVITVSRGTVKLGDVKLVGGRGMFTVPKLNVGNHPLTFTYVGDANTLGLKDLRDVKVGKAKSTVKATFKKLSGQRFKVKITPSSALAVAGGKVEVRYGKKVIAKGKIPAGKKTVTLKKTKKLKKGKRKLTVRYLVTKTVDPSSKTYRVKVR